MTEDPTELAFQRSALYEWQGEPIHWSERHNWIWLRIARENNATTEQDALTAMMVGQITEVEELRALERRLRKDPDGVFDDLGDFFAGFHKDDPATAEALEVFYGQILPDLQASENELDAADGEGDESFPKKSPPEPVTSSTSTLPPGLVRPQYSINSPTHEESNSSPCNSAASATSSSPTSSPAAVSTPSQD